MLAGTTAEYYDGWCGFLVQQALCDQHGRPVMFGTEAEARAAVDDEWLERRIADLDAGHDGTSAG
jgi:hypothetical protein